MEYFTDAFHKTQLIQVFVLAMVHQGTPSDSTKKTGGKLG